MVHKKKNWAIHQSPQEKQRFQVVHDFDFLNDGSLFDADLGGQNLNGLPTTQGTSSNGNLEYEVIEGLDGLIINILNAATGEQSQIIIPN